MELRITDQLRAFLLAILLGAALGVLYDLLRAVRLRRPRLTAVLDLLCCLCAGGSLLLFTLRQTEGQLRGFVLLGALGGGILFFSTASCPLRPVWDFWLDRAAEWLRLLSLPVRSAVTLCKKITRQAKTLFYFSEKYATIHTKGRKGPGTKEERPMARQKAAHAKKASGGVLFWLLILLLLAALGWTLRTVQTQVQSAEAERDRYALQVAQAEQDNEALRADIAEGATEEKMKELAREQLGWTDPNEYVFYDRPN